MLLNTHAYSLLVLENLRLVEHFIFIHLEGGWTREETLRLSSAISIADGKFVGVPQLAVGVGVGVALVSNAQIISTTEDWTITAVAVNGIVSEPSEFVRMVVIVLQREQKCLWTSCIPLI